jgi:uncharacterized protein
LSASAILSTKFTETRASAWCYSAPARGDAHAESDYDAAIFLNDFHDRWTEMDRIVRVVTDILYDQFACIHALPFQSGAHEDRTPLMHEIRNEGRDL